MICIYIYIYIYIKEGNHEAGWQRTAREIELTQQGNLSRKKHPPLSRATTRP